MWDVMCNVSKIVIDVDNRCGYLYLPKLNYPNIYIFVPQNIPSFTPGSPWRTSYRNPVSRDGGFDATEVSDIKYAVVWGDKRYIIPWRKFLPLNPKDPVNIKLKKDSYSYRIEDFTPYLNLTN